MKKKIFIIEETLKNIKEIKNEINFKEGLFIKDYPHTWNTDDDDFNIETSSCFFKLYLSEYSEYNDKILNLFTKKEIEEYEDFSTDLYDFEDFLLKYISNKYKIDSDKIDIQLTKIHSFHTVPFYIETEFFLYDENWDIGEIIEIKFKINSNI